ncbi:hypothetical protein EV368DRAFT_70528, partial [Lentinula lateritia]
CSAPPPRLVTLSLTLCDTKYIPKAATHRHCQKPRVEEILDDDTERQQEAHCSLFPTEEAEWLVTEGKLEEWFKEEQRLRRAKTIELQKELEIRQRERQVASEKEEAQREAEWKDWLRKRHAELGLRKWFFWRNHLKEPQPPGKLSMDALGGGSTSPSREGKMMLTLSQQIH